jgi:protein-tyrosine-phosphatase
VRDRLPGSVLFACDRNAIRSPMAAAIMRHLYGHRVWVESVGVNVAGVEVDPFAVAAMSEIGLDIAGHVPKSFDDLIDDSIDLVVSLTPQAHHRAVDMTRTLSCDVEYWPSADPTTVDGSRETMLAAYRQLRDDLYARIRARFPPTGLPQE